MYQRTPTGPFGIVGYRRATFSRRCKAFARNLLSWLCQPRP